MSRINRVRCDQCGRTEDHDVTAEDGWQHINARVSLSALLGGRPGPEADLCSWGCVRDYAMVQILDPSPEKQ